MKNLKSLFLVAAFALCSVMAWADAQVVVTGTNVRLRKSPSIKGAIYTVNQAPVYPKKGERIKYMGESGDFYKVNYNGNYLYISKQFSRLE